MRDSGLGMQSRVPAQGCGRGHRPLRMHSGQPSGRDASRTACSTGAVTAQSAIVGERRRACGGPRRRDAAGRARRRQQALRRPARAPGHQPHRPPRRGRRRDRPVRAPASRRCAGRSTGWRRSTRASITLRRPAAARRRARRSPTLRADVGMVFQSFNLFAHKTDPRERHARPDQGAQAGARPTAEKQATRAARPGRRRPPGGEVPGAALRRPAAAGRHRPRPGDGAQGDALRRADLRARPGDDQRGARRHGRPRRRTA